MRGGEIENYYARTCPWGICVTSKLSARLSSFGLLRQQEILLSRQIDKNFPATTPLKFWELVNTSNLFPGQKEQHVQLFGTPELSSQHLLRTYLLLQGTSGYGYVSRGVWKRNIRIACGYRVRLKGFSWVA